MFNAAHRETRRWPNRFALTLTCLLVTVAALLTVPRPAAGHGYILRSIPQDRDVLARSPARLQVWFTENLEPRFSTLTLNNAQGEAIALTNIGLASGNPTQLVATVPGILPDGVYILTIRAAFASDGHVGTESLIFWVGQPPGAAQGQLATTGPTQTALPLEVVWRVLSLVGLDVLFGALLLYQAVLLPGWGNRKYAAGELPPRVLLRLDTVLWSALAAALIGSVLALLQQSAALFVTDPWSVLRSGQWLVVLRGTQFGDLLQIRFVLIILAGAIQIGIRYMSVGQPAYVRLLYGANLVVATLALGTVSASSHAAGSTLWPIVAVAADWVHLLANAAWIGGLVALSGVLPVALGSLAQEERQAALLAVLRHFSLIGAAALALLVSTGVFSALIHLRQPSDVVATNYGHTLAIKVLLILPMLAIALYHHAAVSRDRLARWVIQRGYIRRFVDLASSVRLEASLGVVIVLAAAALSATPPPVPAEARAKVVPPSQSADVGDLHLTLSLDPGEAGINGYQVNLIQNDQPLQNAKVYLRFVYPGLDRRSDLIALADVGGGGYYGTGSELDRPGEWQALVDVSLSSSSAQSPEETRRAALRWQVPASAPDPSERWPSVLNWLSGLGVLTVLGVWLWPGTVGRVQGARLQAESVVVGIVALIITVVLVVFGSQLLAEAGQRTESLRNPTPAVVNPALADMASVSGGKAVYQAKCMNCHGLVGAGDGIDAQTFKPGDFRARLTKRHDEDLFAVIPHSNGTPVQPMTVQERWDVINYLRSPAFIAPPSTPTPPPKLR